MNKKIISIILAACMLVSLTSCNGQTDDHTDLTTRTTETGIAPNISEPDQTIDTMETAATVDTTDPSGKYTYTVYVGTEFETTFTLDVSIDDYFVDNGKKSPFFAIGLFAPDMGWEWKESNDDFAHGRTTFYTYTYGDTQMVFQFRNAGTISEDSDNSCGYTQSEGFTYHLAPSDDYKASSRTVEETTKSNLNYGIIVTFAKHTKELCYHTAALRDGATGLSRDDLLVIAYVMSSAKTRPGENPFVGTNLEKGYSMNSDLYLSYTLP